MSDQKGQAPKAALAISGGVAAESGAAFVQIALDDIERLTMAPEEARQLSIALYAAAMEAEVDAFIISFIHQQRGGRATDQEIVDALSEFRRMRGRLRQGRPLG